jgi:hypothetical protein
MSLYSAKQTPEGIRITKFTDDLDVEETAGRPSSYIVSRDVCDCPAGTRDTCRHRQMVPEFTAHDRINKPWFLDWDNHRWYYYHSQTGQLLNRPPDRPAWRRI